MHVDISEAQERLEELLAYLRDGERITLLDNGRAVACLVSADTEHLSPAPAPNGKALLDWLETHPFPDALRRSTAEIDADIAAERAAWD